jgi:hypothetical protein
MVGTAINHTMTRSDRRWKSELSSCGRDVVSRRGEIGKVAVFAGELIIVFAPDPEASAGLTDTLNCAVREAHFVCLFKAVERKFQRRGTTVET